MLVGLLQLSAASWKLCKLISLLLGFGYETLSRGTRAVLAHASGPVKLERWLLACAKQTKANLYDGFVTVQAQEIKHGGHEVDPGV